MAQQNELPDKIIDVPGYGRTAFPGSMSDADIAAAIQRQHPELAPKTEAPAPAAVPEKPKTWGESFKFALQNDPRGNASTGIMKDVASTGLGAYNLFRRAMGDPETPKPDWMKPEGPDQQAGAMFSTGAQYMLPSTLAGKVPQVAKLGLMGRAGVEALISGGVSKVRGEDDTTALQNAAMAGGLTGLTGALVKGGGWLGQRVELGLLKPLKTDLLDVAAPPEVAPATMIRNLFKYDLGGTLGQSLEKATLKTKELTKQLNAALAKNPAAKVDAMQAVDDAIKELEQAAHSNWGTNPQMKRIAEELKNELVAMNPNVAIDGVNLAQAQDLKQAMGYMGSWQNGVRDADSTAREALANSIYTKLKTAIETTSGQSAEIKAINQQFQDIIPIKNALIRRIPVVARRDIMGLKQAIGLATGGYAGLGIAAADQLGKSGRVANALVQASRNPIGAGVAAGRTAPMTAREGVRFLMTPENVPTTIQKK